MAEIEKLYEEKRKKLVNYEKALKRVCVSSSTQTQDGYEKKMRDLEYKIQQMEEEKSILLEIRKA